MKPLKAIRGMNDILPAATVYWQLLEDACRELAKQYNYQEIRLPIVEPTDLFRRTIGQATDIVEKEMYSFLDRNSESITLRPEGTAGCVRAGIQHGLLYNQIQRFWYLGSMFRYERPQRGRYRQFNHFAVEAFGMAGADIEFEHILMMQRLWQKLGLENSVVLQINSLGSKESRRNHREVLVEYFRANLDKLDADSKRRLELNPLRILDSKNPEMQQLISLAPKLLDYLDAQSEQHFQRLCGLLDKFKIRYEINPRLVRGLDYYEKTVYEWVTDQLGAQGSVCAGGRYDGLVEELGGKATSAVGFALGIERVVLLLEKVANHQQTPDINLILVGDEAISEGLLIAERLRDELPNFIVETNLSAASFKSQFKKADRAGASWAFIIASEELAANKLSVKNLRDATPQQQLTLQQAVSLVKKSGE